MPEPTAGASAELVIRGAGYDPKATMLEVAFEGKLQDPPKQVSNVRAFYRAGQVFIIGSPNSGKSTILANLTKATPEIGEYSFTTQTLIPGLSRVKAEQARP